MSSSHFSLSFCRPFTGAWIETQKLIDTQGHRPVAPSRGRGLKQGKIDKVIWFTLVAPSRGRGLKPLEGGAGAACCGSPLHGGVD